MNARWIIPLVALAVGYAVPHLLPSPAPTSPVSVAPVGASGAGKPAPAPAARASSAAASTASHPYSFDDISKFLAYPSGVHRVGGLRRYFRTLAAEEFPHALDDLLSRNLTDADIFRAVMQGWVDHDPAGALEHAVAATGTWHDEAVISATIAWGDRSLAEARAAAAKLSVHDQRITLGNLDKLEAYQKKRAERASGSASASASAATPASGLSNREIFWKNTGLGEGVTSMNEAAVEAFPKWVKEDPEGAAREIAQSTFANNIEKLVLIYEAFKERDPARAEAYLKSLTEWQRQRVQIDLVGKMADDNFAGARAVAESTKDLALRSAMTQQLVHKIFDKNPAAAVDLIQGLSDEVRTALYPNSAVQHWFRRDPEAASAWLIKDAVFWKKFSDPANGRFFTDYQVFLPWMQRDPVAAANFAARMAPHELPDLMADIGKMWMAQDPAQACAWAAKLPPEAPAHAEALKQFTYLWAEHDVKASSQFLGSLPTGPGKTGAAEGFTFSVIDTDPDAALEWVRVIPNEEKRLDVLGRAWANWRSKNSTAATNWLEKNKALTPAERDALESQ